MDEKKTLTSLRIIKAAGISGCLGSLAIIIADILLLGYSGSGNDYFLTGKKTMEYISPDRLYASLFLGALLGPLQAGGVWQIYRGMLPAGKKSATAVFWLFMYAWFLGIAVHGGYIFTGRLYHLRELLTDHSGMASLAMVADSYELYLLTLFIPAGIALAAGSFIFSWMVFRYKTCFQPGTAFFSPLFTIPVFYLIMHLIPEPCGGYIAPSFINCGWFVFFSMTLILHRDFRHSD